MNWVQKQERFREFLAGRGAESAPYRVDLQESKIYWVDTLGLSLAVADCKMICSYALSNRSILMSWANETVKSSGSVEAVEGLPDFIEDCQPEKVWAVSELVGEAVGAEALFRAPCPQSWVMLALWRLRPGGAEQFKTGSPKEHVVRVLGQLANYSSFSERQVLLDNYAESFLQMASHPFQGSVHEVPLRELARAMRNLLVFSNEECSAELERLCADWISK